jgi:redox-sensitive bicupin YhaK (pirin superfamily)
MATIREVNEVLTAQPTLEGAGVRLQRVFGFHQVPELDPFLLLDDFHSSRPEDYLRGFPWHPHRGIETITYVLQGSVDHGDSLGNRGTIGAGDVQWMTAGSGIVHQEMPHGDEQGRLWGFQLWANLPASHKMMHPRYRDITYQVIPLVELEQGAKARVICGSLEGVQGPVQDIVTEPQYLDVSLPAGVEFRHSLPAHHTGFVYAIEGQGVSQQTALGAGNLALYGEGDLLVIQAGSEPLRFLLIAGKPIGEPVAWYGPIVMNTQEELRLAFDEYRNGTFLKHAM